MRSTKWIYYQPNKKDLKDEYSDCVIRAIAKALDMEWLDVFDELIPYARETQSMPNNKVVYEKYLEVKGFKWIGVRAAKGKHRPTPQTFYKSNPNGTYILRAAHHLVTVVDGNFYDTFDSGDMSIYGYWSR